MERTTIMIPDDLRERVKRIAAERGVSFSEFVRQAVEEKANASRRKPKAVGIGHSGYTDTSKLAGEMRPEPRSWR